MTDPRPDVTLDAAALRVLAHPMRLNILDRLRQHGPATARRLAEHFGLDSGAASYHLRRLAAGGLIEEDTERGNRRDRWWRARHRMSYHDPADPPGGEGDSRAYTQALVLAYGEQLRRLAASVPAMPGEWFEASVFSDHTLRLTPAALARLREELFEVIGRYDAGPDADTGTEAVSVRLQAFPLLDGPGE